MNKRAYIDGHEGHPHYLDDAQIKSLKKHFGGESNQRTLQILKNLSDQTKFSIYMLLTTVDEIPVTDICHVLNLSQSAVSHALSDLKKLDLVESSRCGQLRCYSLKKQSKDQSILLSILQRFINK
jgi:DNA-binding transcriptional ArsR family regulator